MYYRKNSDFKRINDQIRSAEVRLIGPEGEQLGVVSKQEALIKAREAGLDLVEVAAQATPPVCRILDYKKYKFEQERRRRVALKKQKKESLKEIRIKTFIEEHDYNVKLKKAIKFLNDGHKVRFRLFLRGREMAHQELASNLFDRIMEDLKEYGHTERDPQFMGRMLIMLILPR